MKRKHHNITIKHDGFTLIEIALVLLVIGVAFLGVLGLGRIGQETVKETNNNARCDNLASAIFETLEIYNHRFSEIHKVLPTKSWTSQWELAIQNSLLEFPPVAGMDPHRNLFITIYDPKATTVYYSRAMNSHSISLGNWYPYYALIIATNTTSAVFNHPNMFHVKLHILPDGDTYSSEERIYTTTLIKHGGLQ